MVRVRAAPSAAALAAALAASLPLVALSSPRPTKTTVVDRATTTNYSLGEETRP